MIGRSYSRGGIPIKKKVKTMTSDNSLEFSSHEMISEELDTKIDFANPYALLAKDNKGKMNVKVL
ncbi:hypothetical protein [Photorhabdus laumondii]|uniref:hypothetical protein n=1 Tax=Photorhabdus laumondii TaxID=2218628 RepID=UPI003D9C9312